MAATPDIVPGLEDFWAPGDETPETLERLVQVGDAHFAKSREPKYPMGVVYQGPWETMHDGVCIAVRRNACALRRSGFPVFLSSLTHSHWNRGVVEKSFFHELPPSVLAEVGHLTEVDHAKTLARILHFVPTTEFLAQQDKPPIAGPEFRDVMLSRTIAYMALEYDRFPTYWVHVFNKLGRLMVPCTKNKMDLQAEGVTIPIDVVPHPMGLRDPMGKVRPPNRRDMPTKLLHVGKWEPRKNQHALIGGFLRAFSPGDAVELTIHSKPFWGVPGYPKTPEESRWAWLRWEGVKSRGWTQELFDEHIKFNWGTLHTREQMAEMYGRHQIYVSSGRAEGFDLAAFDAKVAGHLLVHVGFGGPSDFATGTDVRVRWSQRTKPPKEYGAPEGVMWPHPTHQEYAIALRNAVELLSSDEPLDPFDRAPYRIDTVGKLIHDSVVALAKDHDIDLGALT